MKIVSFGGGVQSTAMAILAVQSKIEVDAFVFCDTGYEQTIVFDFLEKFTKPMLEKSGIPFFTAKTSEYCGNLYGKPTAGNMALPPFFNLTVSNGIGRSPAFCSDIWKTSVFKKFCNENFNKKKYHVLMGFSTDEKHRAGRQTKKINKEYLFEQGDVFGDSKIITVKEVKSKGNKFKCVFPLLDLRMNRGDCVKLVMDTFNAPPPRSSCYFCPNHTQHEWREVMNGVDRDKTIAIDRQIRDAKQFGLSAVGCYLTAECRPIDQCEFDDKNEVIFSRLCAGGCFL